MEHEAIVRIITPSKLPEHYFMGWLQDEIRAGRISIDFSHHPYQYVSDMISDDEINLWVPEIPIVISTQTGTGKNTFVRGRLLHWLVEHNNQNDRKQSKMLILSNRIALNRQSKKKFAQAIKVLSGYTSASEEIDNQLTDDGIDKKTNFGLVDIYSYHQFYKTRPLDSNKYRFIVCDECHFFTSDSLFNPTTNDILHEIIFKGNSAIRIYLSATPDVAFEAILRQEYDNFSKPITELKNANERYKNIDAKLHRVSAKAQENYLAESYYSDLKLPTWKNIKIAYTARKK